MGKRIEQRENGDGIKTFRSTRAVKGKGKTEKGLKTFARWDRLCPHVSWEVLIYSWRVLFYDISVVALFLKCSASSIDGMPSPSLCEVAWWNLIQLSAVHSSIYRRKENGENPNFRNRWGNTRIALEGTFPTYCTIQKNKFSRILIYDYYDSVNVFLIRYS